MKIDFVITWVDGSDTEWQIRKQLYSKIQSNDDSFRYRDWDILKYWFRAVERYAPWVNKVHFVTCGQKPSWLNLENEKLCLVDHKDFIPPEYLPTFNPATIELNFHRINGLSENFVYFNDDTFLNNTVKPSDFFVNGVPCNCAVLSEFNPMGVNDTFSHLLCNDIAFVNSHFVKKEVIRNNFFKWFSLKYGKYIFKNVYYGVTGYGFSMFHNFHVSSPLLKTTYEKVWELEPDVLVGVCNNKFRSITDLNQYILTFYDICTGNFVPRRVVDSRYYEIGRDKALYDDVLSGSHKFICLNDSPNLIDFEKEKEKLISIFEKKFPNKCSFEL